MKVNLYRKYRPRNFSDVVGQETIVASVLNSIRRNSFSHAYLFTGPRGTGKTSTARIIAKTLNCLTPIDGEPCLSCKNCLSIEANTFFDIIEIDAASNRNIDDFRELRDNMSYAPAEGKFKIYIIDEVHMLTTHASNAFLKMLEEPPEYVIFILATTDPQKLIATIISRCQRYDFKSVPVLKIAGRLEEIILAENSQGAAYKYEKEVFTIIASLAQGGMRDAISLLEQVISYCADDLTVAKVSELLGIASVSQIARICDALHAKDGAALIRIADEIVSSGRNIVQFVMQIIDYLRDLLFMQYCSDAEAQEKFSYADSLIIKKTLFSVAELIFLLENFEETLTAIKRSEHGRIHLEIGMLKAIGAAPPAFMAVSQPVSVPVHSSSAPVKKPETVPEKPISVSSELKSSQKKSVIVNEIPVSSPEAVTQASSGTSDAIASEKHDKIDFVKADEPVKPEDTEQVLKTSRDPEQIKELKQQKPAIQNGKTKQNNDLINSDYIKSSWPEIYSQIRNDHPFIAPIVEHAEVLNFEDGILMLGYEEQFQFFMKQITDIRFRESAESVIAEFLGIPVKIDVQLIKKKGENRSKEDILKDPSVKKTVELFGGKIISIQ